MENRLGITRWVIAALAGAFMLVPLYRFLTGEREMPPPAPSAELESAPPVSRAATDKELLQSAGSLEDAVALLNRMGSNLPFQGPALRPDAQPFIEESAAALTRHDVDRQIEIVVYAAVQQLADARAAAVRDALVSRGVDRARLKATGKVGNSKEETGQGKVIEYRLSAKEPLGNAKRKSPPER